LQSHHKKRCIAARSATRRARASLPNDCTYHSSLEFSIARSRETVYWTLVQQDEIDASRSLR
jgi:hypothetical protein